MMKICSVSILISSINIILSLHWTSIEANSIVGLHVKQLQHDPIKSDIVQSESSLPSKEDSIQSNEIHGTPIVPSSIKPDSFGSIAEVTVECNSNLIKINLVSTHRFNGMIYPKGLSTNTSCMMEYFDVNEFEYRLPLRACNTMSTELNDGIEYFNTVIVQPHRRLVTNQGKGYHIRCRYQTKDKRITNSYNLTLSNGDLENRIGSTPLFGTAPIPTSSMKIYHQGTNREIIADNVKIGDRLTLAIAIEQQEIYGMKITNCLVRDGLNWGEQPLINDDGCPVDKEIMGPFEYSNNLTKASVSFHAHKFPYTSSVYYQCNVRLCLKDENGCDDSPPRCDQNGRNYRHISSRSRRDTYDALVVPDISHQHHRALAQRMRKLDKDLSTQVYSGLYVDENENVSDFNEETDSETDSDSIENGKRRPIHHDPSEFCISMRKFAIGVAIASLLLILAVLLLVICILQRRRRRHQHQRLFSSSGSTIGSGSVYSGQYTNRGYSRD
ncbi:Cuticlin-1 [Sarcoptes scabiei]|uniref:Cuticlin-1 n=1 Tax=Sarcoptes scabiei TaxID=52283 RepID=A0A834RCV5_SARSC|nr:Cuticlin-1 [Sarcoptes scabiei]